VRFTGADIVAPRFPDDDGSCPPVIATALAAHWQRPDRFAVARALLGQRLLVPVVALLESTEAVAGHQVEKGSAMATVTIRSARGALALPVFTSVATLTAWDRNARPVAVVAQQAAAAALAEGADVLLLDAAGPIRVALPGAAVSALAESRPWCPPWQDADVEAAVGRIAADHGVDVRAVDHDDDDLAITVTLPVGADPSALAHALSRDVAADPLIVGRLLAGVRLRLEPADGQSTIT
jgi:SseB protein N-terminal domain